MEKLWVYMHVYNDAILPWSLRHYTTISERVIVYAQPDDTSDAAQQVKQYKTQNCASCQSTSAMIWPL